jgi:predicted HicB family RNase H-like nuclease
MSRPVLPPNKSASAIVKLRVHPRQKSAWVRAAQRSGQTLSAWITKVAGDRAGQGK